MQAPLLPPTRGGKEGNKQPGAKNDSGPYYSYLVWAWLMFVAPAPTTGSSGSIL